MLIICFPKMSNFSGLKFTWNALKILSREQSVVSVEDAWNWARGKSTKRGQYTLCLNI